MNNLMGAWEKLSSTIDDDMMIIYPEMYLDNQDMFDEIIAIGYLIKDLRNPETSLDWVTEPQLYRILSKTTSIVVISKLLIVRLRLPWSEVNTEWLCGRKELEEHGDEYEVLETYIWARRLDGGRPHLIRGSETQYFNEHRDEYKITDIKYMVRWKWTDDQVDGLLSNALFLDDNCIAHVYVEDKEFFDDYYNVKES